MSVKSMRAHYNTRATPQNEPIPGKKMKANNAGGFSFEADDWQKLDRFLVLGTSGGTYYVSEKNLTVENAEVVRKLLAVDGLRVVDRIVEISTGGRAAKADPAIFALAMAASFGDLPTRRAALTAMPKVCRIGTHLYHFVIFAEGFRGWGRAMKKAVQNWYAEKSLDRLALQAIKYKGRDGWSHRDLLRLAHPKTEDAERDALYRYMLGGMDKVKETQRPQRVRDSSNRLVTKGDVYLTETGSVPDRSGAIHPQVEAADMLLKLDQVSDVCALIREFRLPREVVPTHFLNDPWVWEALLEDMPMTAMIRNLGKMTKVGLLQPFSDATKKVIGEIGNGEVLRKARVHPLTILAALVAYNGGKSVRGSYYRGSDAPAWTPVQQIVDALDAAFYQSFENVEPCGKNLLLALDVSGSMDWGQIASIPGMTPRMAAAAMALVTANVEANYRIMAYSHRLVEIKISPRMRLDTVVSKMASMSFGGTDCALPMIYATENKLDVDGFISYTDSETWAGRIHPTQALANYRRGSSKNAKNIVVGMVSNGFSIADPNDPRQLDVVGFDTATPGVISDFVRD